MTFSQTLLKELITSIIPISSQEFKKISSIFKEMSLKKGAKPIEIGQSSERIIFVTKGILREYTEINQEEHTLWISSVGDAILDLGGYLSDGPSQISVEALVSSHILYTTKTQLENLLIDMPKMNIVTNLYYHKNLKDFREHMLLLKIWPTQKREELLFENKPYLFRKEVKIKHLASLLNVHPNSLSRIHNQKGELLGPN